MSLKIQFEKFFKGLLLGTLAVIVACQNQPTKIYGKHQVKTKQGAVIPENVFLIDARPAFEYTVAPIHGSMTLRWEDFAQQEEPFLGLLDADYFFHARRLARIGISLNSNVIVIGRGLKGEGEEGRLAWTLRFLGLKNVKFNTIDNYSIPALSDATAPTKSAPIWKPVIDESLLVEKKIFLQNVMKPRSSSDYPIVMDVRTEAEYLGKDKKSYYSVNAPDFAGINVPWTEFFDQKGEIRTTIEEKLASVGITKEKMIYVIDVKGARSAAVTLALRDLGFVRAANFAGGYMELLGRER